MFALKTRLLNALEKSVGLVPKKIVTGSILNREYSTIKGTLRGWDYDDAWLLALAHEAPIIFDVGCNIGQSTLLLLHAGVAEKIVAIDPNPTALSQCAENLIRNNLSPKAQLICAFASNKTGEEVEFFTVGAGSAGSMYKSHAKTAGKINSSSKVPTLTLDSIFKSTRLLPDLVKMDIEGAEALALEGARQIASQGKTRFHVEMHSSPELSMKDNADRVLDWCRSLSYCPWYLKEKMALENSHPIMGRGRCHLLLLPLSQEFPAYLRTLEQCAPLEKVQSAMAL